MLLRHRNTAYHFAYDFAPNDGTDEPVVTVVDGHELDGQILVTNIRVNGRLRPVTVEVLALMEQAAAREELEQGRLELARSLRRQSLQPRKAPVSPRSK